MKHELKVHPEFWDALAAGTLPFQVRRNDRKFAIGDDLVLKHFDPRHGYDGRSLVRIVSHVLHTEDLPVALKPGYVVLGLA